MQSQKHHQTLLCFRGQKIYLYDNGVGRIRNSFLATQVEETLVGVTSSWNYGTDYRSDRVYALYEAVNFASRPQT